MQTRDHDKARWQDCDIEIAMENCMDEDIPLHKPYLWRIKPEPREFWIAALNDGTRYTKNSLTEAEAILRVAHFGPNEIIHVREVLPE